MIGSGPIIQPNNEMVKISIPGNARETGSGYFGAALRMNSALSGESDIQVGYGLYGWPPIMELGLASATVR